MAKKKSGRSSLKTIGIILAVFLLILGCLVNPFSLRALAKLMVLPQAPLHKADVIVVLAGDLGDREQCAVELWKAGHAPRILMSGGGRFFGKSQTDWMAQFAIDQGVPSDNILREPNAMSTLENATLSLQVMRESGITSAIIVTDKYHTSRSKYTFDHFNVSPKIELQYYGCDDKIDYNHWYKDYEMRQEILSEWVKTVLYHVKLR